MAIDRQMLLDAINKVDLCVLGEETSKYNKEYIEEIKKGAEYNRAPIYKGNIESQEQMGG